MIALTGQLAESIGDAVGIGDAALGFYDVFKWPALLLVVTVLIGLLYRASPSGERKVTKWAVLTPGGPETTISTRRGSVAA